MGTFPSWSVPRCEVGGHSGVSICDPATAEIATTKPHTLPIIRKIRCNAIAMGASSIVEKGAEAMPYRKESAASPTCGKNLTGLFQFCHRRQRLNQTPSYGSSSLWNSAVGILLAEYKS